MMIYIHVEEPSMKTALEGLLPKLIGDDAASVTIIDHGSKAKLLHDLPNRLQGYATRTAHENIHVLVLVDRDGDNCADLKNRLEAMAREKSLATKAAPNANGKFRVVNRIVVEELEAWFFGDVPALCMAYPGVPLALSRRAGFRDPDAITGGTHERLLTVLQKAGHYTAASRLPKIEVARKIAAAMNPETNISPSFQHFRAGLKSLFHTNGPRAAI